MSESAPAYLRMRPKGHLPPPLPYEFLPAPPRAARPLAVEPKTALAEVGQRARVIAQEVRSLRAEARETAERFGDLDDAQLRAAARDLLALIGSVTARALAELSELNRLADSILIPPLPPRARSRSLFQRAMAAVREAIARWGAARQAERFGPSSSFGRGR